MVRELFYGGLISVFVCTHELNGMNNGFLSNFQDILKAKSSELPRLQSQTVHNSNEIISSAELKNQSEPLPQLQKISNSSSSSSCLVSAGTRQIKHPFSDSSAQLSYKISYSQTNPPRIISSPILHRAGNSKNMLSSLVEFYPEENRRFLTNKNRDLNQERNSTDSPIIQLLKEKGWPKKLSDLD